MNKMYFVTLILIFFLSYLYKKSNSISQKRIVVFLIFLALLFISGLRIDSTLYSDEWNYRNTFESLDGVKFNTLDLSLINEPGFLLLNWVLANITHNSQVLIFVCSFITNLSFVLFANKYAKDFPFTIFLYITSGMFFTSMNIIRQYLAIAIILFGFKYIINKDIKKFSIYVAIAFFFHKSAIVALFLYYILNTSILDKHKIFSFFVIILLMVSFENVLQLLSNSSYGHYAESFSETGYGTSFIRILFFSLFYLIILWKEKLIRYKMNIDKVFFNSTFVSWCILLLSGIYVFIARLDYFNCCILLLIPTIPYCFKLRDRMFVRLCIYCLFFAFGWYLTLNSDVHHLLNIF